MDKRNKNILDIPEISISGEDKNEKQVTNPNFVLVSQQKNSEKVVENKKDFADQEIHVTSSKYYAKSQESIGVKSNTLNDETKIRQENRDNEQRQSNYNTNQTNHKQTQRKKAKIPAWQKPFIASMAGAVFGCSVFTGGYFVTTNLLTENEPGTSQSSVASNSYINQTSNTTTTSEVVSAVNSGIVTVLTGDRMRNLTGNGSGIVYKNENGKIYIITNAHVVSDAAVVEVYRNDLGVDATDAAEVLAIDTENDIAVLVIDSASHEYPTTIDFENSDNLQVGQKVVAIGSPYVATLGTSFSGSVTEGIISGLDREVTSSSNTGLYTKNTTTQKYIQTDAAINGGNSGGALIDMNGNLVGINSAKISSAENMGLAISANDVLEAMKNMDVPLPNVVN